MEGGGNLLVLRFHLPEYARRITNTYNSIRNRRVKRTANKILTNDMMIIMIMMDINAV